MLKRLLLLVAAALVIAVSVAYPSPARAGDVYVAMTITYYSDSSHTTVVGVCSYKVCRDFVLGNQTCTGTTSAYGVGSNYLYCPPPE